MSKAMPTIREEILNAALGLPESDRLAIAARLMETLPDDQPEQSDDDLAAELDRRSGELEGSVEWDDLRNELRQSLQ